MHQKVYIVHILCQEVILVLNCLGRNVVVFEGQLDFLCLFLLLPFVQGARQQGRRLNASFGGELFQVRGVELFAFRGFPLLPQVLVSGGPAKFEMHIVLDQVGRLLLFLLNSLLLLDAPCDFFNRLFDSFLALFRRDNFFVYFLVHQHLMVVFDVDTVRD